MADGGTRSADGALSQADGPPPNTDPAQVGRRAWIPNFAAIFVCQVFIFVSFSSVFPFLPLVLRELGESEAGAIAWTGFIQSAGALVLLFATPLWGAVADRVGHKPMVLRSMMGAGVALGLMGVATQAWQILVLRLVQGATAGTNAAVMALAASVLPQARLSMGMGLLQTAQFLGVSVGPALGGLAFSLIGYRWSFALSAALMVVIAGLVALVVREPRTRSQRGRQSTSLGKRLATVAGARRLRAPILAVLGFQAAYTVSNTLLPLHLASLTVSGAEAASTIGIVLAGGALGAATGSAAFGWLGGHVNPGLIALGALAGTAALTATQFVLTQPWQFILVRILLGFCAGGVLPSLRSALADEAGAQPSVAGNMGAVYGLSQSAFSGGMVVGPPLSSFVATAWGLPSIHLMSAFLMGATALWYWRAMRAAPARPMAAAQSG